MRKRIKTMIYIIAFIMLAGFIDLFISNSLIQITKQELQFSNLPDSFKGFKIVHISDLHSKSFGNNNEKMVNVIVKESPDIVVMTGDMVNGYDTDFSVFFSFCEQIAGKFKIYYIWGNHEQRLSKENRQKIISFLESKNIVVLNNTKVEINKSSDIINLYGLWYPLRYYSKSDDYNKNTWLGVPEIAKLVSKPNEKEFNILLTHNPIYFESYVEWGADLTLCGHIHGGMIRIPFIGGVLSPQVKLFPKYDAGLFTSNNALMYVSRGLGNGVFPIRFYNRPEIAVLTLQS